MVVQVGICQSQSTKDPSKLMPVSNEAISRMMQLEVVSFAAKGNSIQCQSSCQSQLHLWMNRLTTKPTEVLPKIIEPF